MRKIVIVTSRPTLGVFTLLGRLVHGLVREGYLVDVVNVKRRNIPTLLVDDLRMVDRYNTYDVAIYSGTTYLSPLFSSVPRKYVFLHGYLLDEILYALLMAPPLAKISNLVSFFNWLLIKKSQLSGIICHSYAVCSRSLVGPRDKFVLLPQFILREEVDTFGIFRKLREDIRITTADPYKKLIFSMYTSANPSPRLMSLEVAVKLVEKLNKTCGISLRLMVYGAVDRKIDSSCVVYKGVVTRREFLTGIASSDLYIECNLDEELRFSTLEAGLLGVPIAKITLPDRIQYFDVPNDAMLNSSDFHGLFEKIIQFAVSGEECRREYASRFLDYLIRNRIWDNVKHYLLEALNE